MKAARRALPWAVIGLWLTVVALAAPLAVRLVGVQQDDAVDHLPASADSTRVVAVERGLSGRAVTELVLVYHRAGGLTAADRTTARRQVASIGGGATVSAPALSADRETLRYTVATTGPGDDGDAQGAFVGHVRHVVHTTPTGQGGGGLTAFVGGPAALQHDTGQVFGSLDGTLLVTTALVVTVLLILTYRSPVLWLVPLVAVGSGALVARALVYELVRTTGLTVTGQSGGIMTVLVFGAGTDYALLLVSRYREELRREPDPRAAMRAALRGCGPAVLASSGTVVAGLLCLLAADLNSSRGLGPVGALGVLCALAAMLTLLPALLVVLGRGVFWPLVPAYGSAPAASAGRRSPLRAVGALAARRPVAVLVSGTVLLGALALGLLVLPGPLGVQDSFTSPPDSVRATRLLDQAFPGQAGEPVSVVTPTADAARTTATARATRGVAAVSRGRTGHGWSEVSVLAQDPPGSAGETATIDALRATLPHGTYVGGPSAQQLDTQATDARDRLVVVPLVLAVVLMVLAALLRSLVAPLILAGAVVAVWGAALGLGGPLFAHAFGFAGVDPGLPLLTFVFLVVLGVDYGIFLTHRMREERLAGASPAEATVTALRTTGPVVTSAGVVLAATFAVLTTLPLVMMVEIGFVIAVGVLLDTFLVRTWLVTAASLLLGDRLWWPGRLSRPAPGPAPELPPRARTAGPRTR